MKTTQLCSAWILSLGSLAVVPTALADTITVCASGCNYTSINAAIAAAQNGDVIQLAAETYLEGAEINTLGKAITLRGVVNAASEPASVLDGADSHQVLRCGNGETTATVFENLVIQNGTGYDGGGMRNYGSSPTLNDCTFTQNTANYGGGMRNYSNSPTLNNCTFTQNTANYGGGMLNSGSKPSGSNPTLTDCILCSNTPDQISGLYTDLGGNCIMASCYDCFLCIGDINGNGAVDAIDLSALLSAWGTNGQGAFDCDIDDDGIVSGTDMAIILVGWGSCPN